MFPLQKAKPKAKPDAKKAQAIAALRQDMKKPAAQSSNAKARARAVGKMF